MENLTITLTFILFIFASSLFAQEEHDHSFFRCGFTKADTEKEVRTDEFEVWMRRKNEETLIKEASRSGDVLNIPVVFHIIHNNEAVGTGLNLSAAQIQAQLDQVNNDLRRTTGTSGFNSDARSADTEIELKLAFFDEDDNELLEPGINRISGYGGGSLSKSYMNSTVKPATQWDPKQYLNIWVCNLSGILGFAQFPDINPLLVEGVNLNGTDKTDGIVLVYKAVGSTESPNPSATGAYAPYGMGRSLTHELGHFLGLRHIWGDGGCGIDDYCADTPESDGANFGCPSTHVSCGTTDMVQNYMDYTYDNCMNVFTADQRLRMRTVLYNSVRRVELLSSDRANPPSSLPVELVDFKVEMVKGNALLTWETASESNNDIFIVSKSNDGVNYEDLYIVQGKGNTVARTQYEYIDTRLENGTTYYKISQVDYDNTKTELGVRTIKYSDGFTFSLFPNPSRNTIHIKTYSTTNDKASAKIFDSQGKLIKAFDLDIMTGDNHLPVDINELERGIYFIQITAKEEQKSVRFQKI